MYAAIISLCSAVEFVPMVSFDIEQYNGGKSGLTLQLELQDMLNSHDMNPVLGSKVDELKVGSKQQEQLHLSPKLNFLNALMTIRVGCPLI